MLMESISEIVETIGDQIQEKEEEDQSFEAFCVEEVMD